MLSCVYRYNVFTAQTKLMAEKGKIDNRPPTQASCRSLAWVSETATIYSLGIYMVCMPSYFFFLSFLLYTNTYNGNAVLTKPDQNVERVMLYFNDFCLICKRTKMLGGFFFLVSVLWLLLVLLFLLLVLRVSFLLDVFVMAGAPNTTYIYGILFVDELFFSFFWRIFSTVSFIRESSLRSVIFMGFFLFLLRIHIANSQLLESFVLFSLFFLFLHLVNFVLTERSGKCYSYQTIDTLLKRIY